MDKVELMARAMASFAAMGDIYTDAHECASAVAAAQNLTVLAQQLAANTEEVLVGKLLANSQFVCMADVLIDGTLVVKLPDGFEMSNYHWTLQLGTQAEINVAMFDGDDEGDETWVVDDAEAFYAILLRNA